MTPNPERLIALHLRLTEDHANAFTGDGSSRGMCPTPEGLVWLRDYRRYRLLWRELQLAGHDPAQALKARLGYIPADEVDDIDAPEGRYVPRNNGRGRPETQPLRWYEDTETGPEDAA